MSIVRICLVVLSVVGLVLTVLPACLFFAGVISLEDNRYYMIVGAVLWFATTPFWMNRKTDS